MERVLVVDVPIPTVGGKTTIPDDLAVVSANNVWQVGWDISHSVSEHWDGNDWSVVPSP